MNFIVHNTSLLSWENVNSFLHYIIAFMIRTIYYMCSLHSLPHEQGHISVRILSTTATTTIQKIKVSNKLNYSYHVEIGYPFLNRSLELKVDRNTDLRLNTYKHLRKISVLDAILAENLMVDSNDRIPIYIYARLTNL